MTVVLIDVCLVGDFFPKKDQHGSYAHKKWPVSSPSVHGFDRWEGKETQSDRETKRKREKNREEERKKEKEARAFSTHSHLRTCSWFSTEASAPSTTTNCGCNPAWSTMAEVWACLCLSFSLSLFCLIDMSIQGGCVTGGGVFQADSFECTNYWHPTSG